MFWDYEYWMWDKYSEAWNKGKSIQEFYPDGNMKLLEYFFWNNDSSKHIPSSKNEYEYEENFWKAIASTYDINSGEYYKTKKYEYYTNRFNEDSIHIEYNYNSAADDWDNWTKTDYAYDTLGNKISEHRYNWDDTYWKNTALYNYQYDTLSNITYYDMFGLSWDVLTPRTRNYYEYDSLFNMTHSLSKVYNNNEWVNNSQSFMTYDEESRQISEYFPNHGIR